MQRKTDEAPAKGRPEIRERKVIGTTAFVHGFLPAVAEPRVKERLAWGKYYSRAAHQIPERTAPEIFTRCISRQPRATALSGACPKLLRGNAKNPVAGNAAGSFLPKSWIVCSDPSWLRGAIRIHMNEKDAKNSIDSAHPTPEAAKRLTEKEKKAVEIGGLIEHEHGQKREDLEKQVKELTE